MTSNFSTAMRRAMDLTRASNVQGATRAIQDALSFGREESPTAIEIPAITSRLPASEGRSAFEPSPAPTVSTPSVRAHKPLSEVIRLLKKGRATVLDVPAARMPPGATPEGAQFLSRVFSGDTGSRRYKVYVPKSSAQPPCGLIVMLHGCQQNSDDFAVGTGMNAIAESKNFIVAYPQQEMSANAGACWNWFEPAHQLRDRGEPASIAAITRALVTEFNVPSTQVFVAGLSAGGAMAAVLVETYPDVYAAAGIHSGLAYGSATDVMSAFAVMRGDKAAKPRVALGHGAAGAHRMIIFQGSADATVHSSNAQQLVDGSSNAKLRSIEQQLGDQNGRNVDRQVFKDESGLSVLEVWRIEGAGHAWSGGYARGSFADPKGPDASAEMVRFFWSDRG